MSSAEIEAIVSAIYRDHLPIPPQWIHHRDRFVANETARLSALVAQDSAETAAQAIGNWTREHGRGPDFLTRAGLINAARTSALERILNSELYERIPEPEDPEVTDLDAAPPTPAPEVPWDQRWTVTYYRSEPDEPTEMLIEHLWPAPEYSTVFRIKAGYLLAARTQDGLTLPQHPDDPLTAALAEMIRNDLRHDGLPDR